MASEDFIIEHFLKLSRSVAMATNTIECFEFFGQNIVIGGLVKEHFFKKIVKLSAIIREQ